jgi:hypothetical protein
LISVEEEITNELNQHLCSRRWIETEKRTKLDANAAGHAQFEVVAASSIRPIGRGT